MLERVVVLSLELDNQPVETRILGADLLLKQVGALSQIGTNIMHGRASPENTHKPRFRRRVPAKKAAGRSSTDQLEFSRLCTEAHWLGRKATTDKTASEGADFKTRFARSSAWQSTGSIGRAARRRIGIGGVDPRWSCAQA